MMRSFDERMNHFREDMDDVLQELKSDTQLKQRVLNSVHQKGWVPRRKWNVLVGAFLIATLLVMGTLQIPSVKAQVFPLITEMITWVEQKTNIPVYIPESWKMISESNSDNTSYFYFEVTGDPDSYGVNVYRLETPVPFNNEEELLKKNGPLSESQRVGSIKGQVLTDKMPALTITPPSDTTPFELSPGVTAYQNDQGTQIYWSQGNWIFEFIGSSSALSSLKKLSTVWSNSIAPADKGIVKIVGGNKMTNYFTWDEGGNRYTFEIVGTDYQEITDILNDYRRWKLTLDK